MSNSRLSSSVLNKRLLGILMFIVSSTNLVKDSVNNELCHFTFTFSYLCENITLWKILEQATLEVHYLVSWVWRAGLWGMVDALPDPC